MYLCIGLALRLDRPFGTVGRRKKSEIVPYLMQVKKEKLQEITRAHVNLPVLVLRISNRYHLILLNHRLQRCSMFHDVKDKE